EWGGASARPPLRLSRIRDHSAAGCLDHRLARALPLSGREHPPVPAPGTVRSADLRGRFCPRALPQPHGWHRRGALGLEDLVGERGPGHARRGGWLPILTQVMAPLALDGSTLFGPRRIGGLLGRRGWGLRR